MDQKDQQGQEQGSCCSRKGCCGCKALGAVALLLVGAAGGFFAGRHCGRVCAAPAAMSAPAQPSK